jgi:molecular chaperone DnaK (HSP70)
MIVDCGGGTVDLTTRKLINNEQLGEITERAGDFCGSTFIDAEFIKYLQKKLGDEPLDLFRDNDYGQMQYLIQEFCRLGKIPFTGEDPDFSYELDINSFPTLKQYVTDENVREALEDDEWIIEINFDDMKSIFEPVVQRILHLITAQLDNTQESCSAMFLVGGFSESKYLQQKIRDRFNHQVNDNISVPIHPMAAIARGAALYGLSIKSSYLDNVGNDVKMKCVIASRTLKYTYGVDSILDWVCFFMFFSNYLF